MLPAHETTGTRNDNDVACLTFEQMLGYVEKTLSEKMRAKVENHLISCELCSEAMEGFAAFLEKAKLRPMIESLNAQIEARYATKAAPEARMAPAGRLTEVFQSVINSVREGIETLVSALATPRYGLKLAYAVAAVFLVGIVSVFYPGREKPNAALFAEYYQPYPNVASSVRGEIVEGKLQDAMQQYDAGDFKATLALLQEILAAEPGNTTAQFYAGISCLKLKETEKAVISLQKVIARPEQKLAEPAEWYLALSYLQKNDLVQTRTMLNEIIMKDHAYKEHATRLLERLRSLE
jgi:hypothetical protein